MTRSLAVRCLLVAAALITLVTEARSQETPGNTEMAISHGGRQRTARVYVAPGYKASKPAPLVLMLHGGGGNAENAERTAQMQRAADRHGLIVVYPNGTGVLNDRLLTWNAANCCGYAMQQNVDDVGFVRELIAVLKQQYAIDPRRVYATGLSNGGMMAYRLGCELSDQIAAIAPIAAALNTESCTPEQPVSAVIFHGTEDQYVLFNGGINNKRFPGARPRVDKSVHHAYTTWARITKCQPAPSMRLDTHVVKTACTNGTNGSEVVLYAIEGQGHAWPGGKPGVRNGNVDPPSPQLSATEVMIEFFLRHPKQ